MQKEVLPKVMPIIKRSEKKANDSVHLNLATMNQELKLRKRDVMGQIDLKKMENS